MMGLLRTLVQECGVVADCFVGREVEHVHTRERLLAIAPQYYLVDAGCRLRTGDRIWFRDKRERVVNHELSGCVLILHTCTDAATR